MAMEDSMQDIRPTSSAWQPDSGMKIMRVELYDSLTIGGSAMAYAYDWREGEYQRSTRRHTVHGNMIKKDLIGAAVRGPGSVGDLVYVAYFDDSRRWEVIGPGKNTVTFKNESGEALPAHAMGKVVDFSGSIFVVKKPEYPPTELDYDPFEWIVNGSDQIADDGYGEGYLLSQSTEWPMTFLYASGGTHPTPAKGDLYGPIDPAGWALWRGCPMIRVIGDVDTSAHTFLGRWEHDRDHLLLGEFSGGSPASLAADKGSVLKHWNSLIGSTLSPNGQPRLRVDDDLAMLNCVLPLFALQDCPAATTYRFPAVTGQAKPVVAKVFGTNAVSHNHSLGVDPRANGEDALMQYLPGFVTLSSRSAGSDNMLVIADPWATGHAKAIANWAGSHPSYTVLCQPCDGTGGAVYDGSSANFPDIQISVNLPCPIYKSPNVRTGNVIRFTWATGQNNRYATCLDNIADDKVGTIKMFNSGSGSLIPQGWQLADGTNGTLDLRSQFIVGHDPRTGGSEPAYGDATKYPTVGLTGGTKTHTHANVGTGMIDVTNGAKAMDAADHRPPFIVVAFIQRVA